MSNNPECKRLRFTKMHGLGNDFMVIDLINQTHELNPTEVANWADRHTGIGFDQLLVVSESPQTEVDFRYRIFNSDGSEVEQCGNGARCFARFVLEKGLTDKNPIAVETSSGIISLDVKTNGDVTVNMGAPIFEPEQIPLALAERQRDYAFSLEDQVYTLNAVSMGNPHGVLKVASAAAAPVKSLGPRLENHPLFPNRANIGFMEVINEQQIKLRVFERGVGETKACGTGACAAAVVAIQQQWAKSPVSVSLPGGDLLIEWRGEGEPVLMTGPAATVFEGEITL